MVHPTSRTVENFYWLWSISDATIYLHVYVVMRHLMSACFVHVLNNEIRPSYISPQKQGILAVPHDELSGMLMVPHSCALVWGWSWHMTVWMRHVSVQTSTGDLS